MLKSSAADLAVRLKLKRTRRGYVGTCPACGYQGALSLGEGEDGRLLLHCHVGCDFQTIAGKLSWSAAGGDAPKRSVGRSAPAGQGDFIQRLFSASQSAQGSVVVSYLAARGITLSPPPDLRFLHRHRHVPSGGTFPVMVGIVRATEGGMIGLHRTYLRADGTAKAPVEPAKMTLGPIGGGAVRLHADHAALGMLGITEGIETGLSVAQATDLPVWAGLSAGGIERLLLPPLPLAREVLIFADHDQHGRGERAAMMAAERFSGEGRKVRVAVPPTVDADFNDILLGAA